MVFGHLCKQTVSEVKTTGNKGVYKTCTGGEVSSTSETISDVTKQLMNLVQTLFH